MGACCIPLCFLTNRVLVQAKMSWDASAFLPPVCCMLQEKDCEDTQGLLSTLTWFLVDSKAFKKTVSVDFEAFKKTVSADFPDFTRMTQLDKDRWTWIHHIKLMDDISSLRHPPFAGNWCTVCLSILAMLIPGWVLDTCICYSSLFGWFALTLVKAAFMIDH